MTLGIGLGLGTSKIISQPNSLKLSLCLGWPQHGRSGPTGVGTKWKVGRLRNMASAVARGYNGGLGAVPPAGSRGRAPGQPKAFALFGIQWMGTLAQFLCFALHVFSILGIFIRPHIGVLGCNSHRFIWFHILKSISSASITKSSLW